MEVKLILLGKTNAQYLIDGERKYDNRLKHYLRFKETIIPEIKNAGSLSIEQIKSKEGLLIMKQLDKSDFVVLLDDKGTQFSSEELSLWLQKKMNAGMKSVTFIVGGAYGFSKDIIERSNYQLSLSRMTFSHQMVRLIFKEQLYRACTILKGEPYHHK
jgi:23S rRNA (pseudouridine1915-N3)-methyltransferase